MATSLRTNPLPNAFDRSEAALRARADRLDAQARGHLGGAAAATDAAAGQVGDAFDALEQARANADKALAASGQGAGQFVSGVGHSARGVAHAIASGAGRVAHLGEQAVEAVARAASRFFEKLSKVLAKLGDEKLVTTRELRTTKDALQAFYELQGELAQKGFSEASESFRASWSSWAEAMSASLQAGGDLGVAAAHLAKGAALVTDALGHTAAAGAAKTAAQLVQLTELAVNAAQTGVSGAAELAALTARHLGATANVISLKSQDDVEVGLSRQTKLLEESLRALAAEHPALATAVQGL